MKKILLVIVVLLGILIPKNVLAIEDSFYEGEYISRNYIVKIKDGVKKYSQMKVFRRTSDNTPVYCIQLWETLNSNKVIPGYDTNQDIESGLSKSVWDWITLIAYYGYGYGNHTDIKWYAATQYMIWRSTTSTETTLYFTDTLNGNYIDKYQDEINEIYDLILNHNKYPSFNNSTYQIRYKERMTITDSNKKLNDYEIIEQDGINVTKNGNALSFMTTNIGESTVTLVDKDKMYNHNTIVYIDNEGQNILLPGSYPTLYAKVTYNLSASTLTINKLDSDTYSNNSSGDAILNDSSFQLVDKDNDVIASGKTDNNGKLVFNNIGYGNYTLKEVASGKGYKLGSNITVKVSQSNTNINYYNQVYKNRIAFNKYLKNSVTNQYSVEKKAKFQILDSSNNLYQEFETDDNGFYQIYLPYGTYTVKQVKGITGYKLVDDFTIDVIEDNKEQIFNLYNEIYTNKIIINKYLRNSLIKEEVVEEGAKFQILDSNNNIYQEFETDSNGKYEIILPYGTYTLKQITGTPNYKLVEDKIIKVDETIEEQTFNLYNEILKVELSINNIDNYSKHPILSSGSSFEIIDTNNEKVIEVLKTDDSGKTNSLILSSGNYLLKQAQVVDGYIINSDSIILDINEENYTFDNEKLVINVPNNRIKGQIQMYKEIEYYLDDELINKEIDDNLNLGIYAKEDIYSKDNIKIYDKDSLVYTNNSDNYLLDLGEYYIKNKDDIISVLIDNSDIKKVKLVDKVYEYTNNNLIIDVPDTYDEDNLFSKIYLVLLYLGFILMIGVKKDEKE